MKEAVRRAIVTIRAHRFSFEAIPKGVGDNGMPDMVTTADQAAQRVMCELLSDWFPQAEIVAEEGDLSRGRPTPDGLWFTVDPLDGTAAFIRRASHGIGSMLALMRGTKILGAVVGDVMTQEIYAASPGSKRVHRISEFGFAEPLAIDTTRRLQDQWVLLRDSPELQPQMPRAMVEGSRPLFRGIEVGGASIGLGMARLWKGEVGGVLLPPRQYTPWDLNPVLGLSHCMGFEFLQVNSESGGLTSWKPESAPRAVGCEHPLLVVHSTRLTEVARWRTQML